MIETFKTENSTLCDDLVATLNCLISLEGKTQRLMPDYNYGEAQRLMPDCNDSDAQSSLIACNEGENQLLDCNESGTTLRLLMPVIGGLGIECSLIRRNSLLQRPVKELSDELERHGLSVSFEPADDVPTSEVINISGRLEPGVFKLPANISSQYISGLLLAMPLLQGESKLKLSGVLQSRPYIEMTLQAMRCFGIAVDHTADMSEFTVNGNQRYLYSSSCDALLEKDWSAGAMWLAAGLLRDGLAVEGLKLDSIQGDKTIVQILKKLSDTDGSEIIIDISDCPDIVPAIALASLSTNKAIRIVNASRLRMKESDRLELVAEILECFGARTAICNDELFIEGKKDSLESDEIIAIDARGDHRMVMLAALASLAYGNTVCIAGADGINKSYPEFFEAIKKLGGVVSNGL